MAQHLKSVHIFYNAFPDIKSPLNIPSEYAPSSHPKISNHYHQHNPLIYFNYLK
ncbi:MAG: hypothetical protein WCP01_08210 [Methylococcaceae bacterium]